VTAHPRDQNSRHAVVPRAACAGAYVRAHRHARSDLRLHVVERPCNTATARTCGFNCYCESHGRSVTADVHQPGVHRHQGRECVSAAVWPGREDRAHRGRAVLPRSLIREPDGHRHRHADASSGFTDGPARLDEAAGQHSCNVTMNVAKGRDRQFARLNLTVSKRHRTVQDRTAGEQLPAPSGTAGPFAEARGGPHRDARPDRADRLHGCGWRGRGQPTACRVLMSQARTVA